MRGINHFQRLWFRIKYVKKSWKTEVFWTWHLLNSIKIKGDFAYRLEKKSLKRIDSQCCSILSRALPDITSVPEVRQIFKIRTVRKPDVFLPGRWTLNPLENRKKNQKKSKNLFSIFKLIFKIFFLLIY